MRRGKLIDELQERLGSEAEVAGYIDPTLGLDATVDSEISEADLLTVIVDLWQDQNKLRADVVRLQRLLAFKAKE